MNDLEKSLLEKVNKSAEYINQVNMKKHCFNRLRIKWLNKLQKGESVDIADLYEFSKVKLKRSRIRKKFRKDYERYIPNEISESYKGILFVSPLFRTFKRTLDFDIDPMVHENGLPSPKGELYYFDDGKICSYKEKFGD